MNGKKEFKSNRGGNGFSKNKSGGFQSMGFSWQILKSIINSGYKLPTPIQRKAIPEILLGKDVVAMARTGSGKTAAFLLPMFQKLHERDKGTRTSSGPRALIMSPTRELALQTFKFAKQFGKYLDFKAAVILGGDKIEDQFEVMHEKPDIIIATPGRFLHICIEMNLKLSSIEYVVFDEADRLFEMGFKEQLNEILSKLPVDNRQTLLFSATLPLSLVEFARAGLQNPVLIRLDVESKLSDKLRMAFLQCRNEDKLAILIYLLKNIIKAVKNPAEFAATNSDSSKRLEQTLIFVATKHHVEFLKDLLDSLGYVVSYAYSSLDQTARQINIAKFQNKKSSIMIVTDVAARGIDIPMLDNVINMNFPAKAKLFVHRVGRVARAGQSGNSFTLVNNDELPYMHELHEFLSKQIKFATEDMGADDWSDVYGSVPQSIISVEKDTISSLIQSKIELQGLFEVQENAYKQYLKSRPLPSSTSVRGSKNIRMLHPSLPAHPLLKNDSELKESFMTESNLLEKLRNYSTKTTIFEINKTTQSQQGALIMKKKRERDEKLIEKHKAKEICEDNLSLFQKSMYSIQNDLFKKETENDQADDSNENDDNEEDTDFNLNDKLSQQTYQDDDFVIKITNNDDDDKVDEHTKENLSETKKGKGRKRKSENGLSKKAEKRQKQQVIDYEHFIPYKPKNFHTEKALGINTSFNREVNDASMDMMADSQEDIRKQMQKSKWDRKKKKFVSVQSTMEKNKKIKTESGNYINASYKTDTYAKWLKKNQSKLDDDNDNDENQANNRRNRKFFGSSSEKKYFGNHKFKSTGKPGVKRFKGSTSKTRRSNNENENFSKSKYDKRPRLGLKNKDQIIKERERKSKIQKFQKNRKQGNKKSFKQRSK